MEAPAPRRAAPRARERAKSVTREIPFLVVVAIALALFMKAFIVQAFYIPSGSMEKTLHGCTKTAADPKCQGDRVLVNKVVYKFRDIHRGEIVVFNGKDTGFPSEAEIPPPKNRVGRLIRNVQHWLGLGAPNEKDYIKRVIGIGGDVVACCTNGHVTVNGEEVEEPYVFLDSTDEMSPFKPQTVPDGELWVMGDHRDGSSDSRAHGPIPERAVIGRAFAVFFPWGRHKVLWVPGTFQSPQAAPPVLGLALAVPITVVRRKLRRRTD